MLILMLLLIWGTLPQLAAQSSIDASGLITGNTTWTNDTIKVTGDILVPDSVTLTVNPGVRVEFQGHYTLQVWGTLLAVGTESEKITFTIHDTIGFSDIDTTLGGWNRIWFT